MGKSSPLAIATAAVIRLVKEEESYHHELETQKHRIQKFEDEPVRPEEDIENKNFLLKQERQALEETKKVLPSLKQKIADAVAKLDTLLLEEGKKGMDSNVAEIDAAKEAMSRAKTATREIS